MVGLCTYLVLGPVNLTSVIYGSSFVNCINVKTNKQKKQPNPYTYLWSIWWNQGEAIWALFPGQGESLSRWECPRDELFLCRLTMYRKVISSALFLPTCSWPLKAILKTGFPVAVLRFFRKTELDDSQVHGALGSAGESGWIWTNERVVWSVLSLHLHLGPN